MLSKYFDSNISDQIIKEKTISKLQNLINCNSSKNYSDFGLHCGQFTVKKTNSPFFWIYNNLNINHGNFVILNDALEIVYLSTNMGFLYKIEINDPLDNGQEVLLVTNGAGGTGVYSKNTDLIVFDANIPIFKGSILKEIRDSNLLRNTVPDNFSLNELRSLEDIKCEGRTSILNNSKYKSKKGLGVKLLCSAQVNKKNLNKNKDIKLLVY